MNKQEIINKWTRYAQEGEMPLDAEIDEIVDLPSTLVYNYREQFGCGQVIFRNGWFYWGGLTDKTWQRCSAIEKLDPIYFNRR